MVGLGMSMSAELGNKSSYISYHGSPVTGLSNLPYFMTESYIWLNGRYVCNRVALCDLRTIGFTCHAAWLCSLYVNRQSASIMSRLSRANVKARESIFTSGPEQYIGDTQARCPPDLEECVMAMEDCCEEVYKII